MRKILKAKDLDFYIDENKYINDNDELIKILDNFLTTFKTSTKDNQNNSKYTHKEYEQDPDWNNAIVFADDEEDCGCGSR